MPWSIIDLRHWSSFCITFCCLDRLPSEANPHEVKSVIKRRVLLLPAPAGTLLTVEDNCCYCSIVNEGTHTHTHTCTLECVILLYQAHFVIRVQSCWLIKVKQMHEKEKKCNEGWHVSALTVAADCKCCKYSWFPHAWKAVAQQFSFRDEKCCFSPERLF